jgi:uncharacterized protein YfaT (DUF1175 family)
LLAGIRKIGQVPPDTKTDTDMAKYLITHACGCEQTIQLFGKSSERDWRIQKEEQKLCPECYAKAQQAERQKAGEQAAQLNFQMGCKPLEGSEKQVAWAETIRFSRLDALQTIIQETAARVEAQAVDPKFVGVLEAMRETMAWASGITDSKWWIDHRDPYVTQTQQDTMAAVMAAFTGRRLPAAPRSKVDMIKGMMLVSPHLTLSVAEAMGIAEEWKKRQEDAAKLAYQEERMQTHDTARDAARAVGIVGAVKVWTSADGDHRRVYGDDFTYYHMGKMAGTLENKSSVKDDDLRAYCAKLCGAWKNLRFHA